MSFLAPWALALAALALVPLALHLVRRDTRRRVPFPALRYLRSAERRHARSLRVRDRWLAVARVALIVCLAAAASRPLVGRGGPESHPPTDVALVLDNTASMERVAGDRTLLDLGRQSALRTLSFATPEDRFWVATPVDGIVAAAVGPDEAEAALDAIRGSDAAGSVPLAARDAFALIPAERGRAREVQAFSDGQRASMRGDAELDARAPVALFLPGGDDPANAAVLDLAVHPASPVPVGAPLAVTVGVARWPGPGGPAPDEGEMRVRLLVDGELAAAGRAGPDARAVIALPPLEPGGHLLRAEIDPAGLRSDDGRQVGIRVGDPVRVAPPAGPEAEFVTRALETLAAAGRVRLPEAGEAADVRFRTGGTGGTPASSGPRPATLVLIPPADPLGLPAFVQELAAAGVPWTLERDLLRGELRLSGDPIADEGARVRSRHRLRRTATPSAALDSVLLRTGDGEPWAVRGTTAAGTPFVLLASALVPAATDLPTGVSMVPFVETLVAVWARPGTAPAEREAGVETALPDRADSLAAPGGPSRAAEGGAPWRPRTAGAWRLSLDDGPDGGGATWVGVNVPREESDPARATEPAIAAALGPGTRVIEAPEAWSEAVFAERRGRDASPALLLLALALLVAEALLAAPRGRARAEGAGRRETGESPA